MKNPHPIEKNVKPVPWEVERAQLTGLLLDEAKKCFNFDEEDGRLILSERSVSPRFLALLARVYHGRGIAAGASLEELAKTLGGNHPTQVRRLLKHAETKQIVRIVVSEPKGTIESQLEAKYGLTEVRIAPTQRCNGDVSQELGVEAAQLFHELYKRRGAHHVAIGGGRTMFAMVEAIEIHTRVLNISPLTFFTRAEQAIVRYEANCDAPFLANAIAWKCRCAANVCAVPPLPDPGKKSGPQRFEAARTFTKRLFEMSPALQEAFQAARNADVIFTGLGSTGEDTSIIPSFERVGISVESLRNRGVGHLNFNIFDAEGEDVTDRLTEDWTPESCNHCHPFLAAVNLSTIRAAAVSPKRDVVLVAGGIAKFHAIRAALAPKRQGKVCNRLVTDQETAEQLLKEPLPSPR